MAWVLIRQQEQISEIPDEKVLVEAERLLNAALSNLSAEEDRWARTETFFHLGYLEKRRGHSEAAGEFFVQALELSPDFEPAKLELESLGIQ